LSAAQAHRLTATLQIEAVVIEAVVIEAVIETVVIHIDKRNRWKTKPHRQTEITKKNITKYYR
jgi:hypothetical protein